MTFQNVFCEKGLWVVLGSLICRAALAFYKFCTTRWQQLSLSVSLSFKRELIALRKHTSSCRVSRHRGILDIV